MFIPRAVNYELTVDSCLKNVSEFSCLQESCSETRDRATKYKVADCKRYSVRFKGCAALGSRE